MGEVLHSLCLHLLAGMSGASLTESQRNRSVNQEEVQSEMDKSVTQAESLTDDTHFVERNGEDDDDDEGQQDTVMQQYSSNDRVDTVTEETSAPETPQNIKVKLSTAHCPLSFCSMLLL